MQKPPLSVNPNPESDDSLMSRISFVRATMRPLLDPFAGPNLKYLFSK